MGWRVSGSSGGSKAFRATGLSLSVFVTMPMMKVGVVRMPMHKRAVLMPVGVRLTRRSVRPMRMLMMFVMCVPVLVLHRLVRMLMLIAFRQVQP